jgi:hypothetical protein
MADKGSRREVEKGEKIPGFSRLFRAFPLFSTMEGPYFRDFHVFPGWGACARPRWGDRGDVWDGVETIPTGFVPSRSAWDRLVPHNFFILLKCDEKMDQKNVVRESGHLKVVGLSGGEGMDVSFFASSASVKNSCHSGHFRLG